MPANLDDTFRRIEANAVQITEGMRLILQSLACLAADTPVPLTMIYNLFEPGAEADAAVAELPGLYLWRRALQYIATADKAWLVGLDTAPKPCFEASFAAPYQALVNEADDLFSQMERNEITPETAAARLFARLQASDFLPHPGYAFGDPHTLHNDFTRASTLAKIIFWVNFALPNRCVRRYSTCRQIRCKRLNLKGESLTRCAKNANCKSGRSFFPLAFNSTKRFSTAVAV